MPRPRVPQELRGRPFLTADAKVHGVTASMLGGSSWRRLAQGIYVSADVPVTRDVLLEAVRLVIPEGAVVSGKTAALLHGCDLRRDVGELCEVTAPRGITLVRSNLIVPRQALVPDSDIVDLGGLLVTSPMRTAFDLARRPDLAEAVVALDAMWRAGLVDPDELAEFAAEHRGWRGIRQVPRVIAMADKRAENPMESRLRMSLVLGGLPKPEVQLRIVIDGHEVARLDLAYEWARLDLEYDGREHWTDRVRQRRDTLRNHDLVALGWTTLAFGANDVFRRGAYICQRVGQVLRRAA